LRTLRIALATGAVVVTMAHFASAADLAATTTTSSTTSPTTSTTTASPTTTSPTTTTPATGVTATPVPAPAGSPKPSPHPAQGAGNHGGADHGNGGLKPGQGKGNKGGRKTNNAGGASAPGGPAPLQVSPALGPLAPTSCAAAPAAPAALMPIYQQASDAYALGPQGPGILASINGIESGFGANLGPSSAGAVGWMQFLPSTWSIYGVDANGDGTADPNNPNDAIFAAARYLQAAGMPADPASAIFSYNHADWYVQEVLANAGCYGASGLSPFGTGIGAQTLTCTAAHGVHVPDTYMAAIEDAASRYDLGQRGTWTMLAIARLESNFGRGMSNEQLITAGPLGLDRDEWNRFEVDGDGDGRIEPADIYDSAATLAREIWSQPDLQSGIFLHNQAEWYVQQVLDQAKEIQGGCTQGTASWTVALPNTGSNLLVASSQVSAASLSIFDGKQVCSYMVPILQAARQLGWQGQVTSGYRSFAEQSAIHASGVYSAAPGQSNHEGCAGLTYGPANGAVDVSDPAGFGAAMAKLGYPLRNTLGAVDPVHFSPGGN
jgi:Transglycosylase SLT domain